MKINSHSVGLNVKRGNEIGANCNGTKCNGTTHDRDELYRAKSNRMKGNGTKSTGNVELSDREEMIYAKWNISNKE